MNIIIKKIFLRTELQQQLPILIDIGASGSLHPKWRKIAKYSWCIVFDAYQRDFQFTEDISRLVPLNEKVATFWPRLFAQFSKRKVVPLDGIIGSNEYFQIEYLFKKWYLYSERN